MGVFDFKIDARSGETVWLEVNPQGQFFFLQGLSGSDLRGPFCQFLVRETLAGARQRARSRTLRAVSPVDRPLRDRRSGSGVLARRPKARGQAAAPKLHNAAPAPPAAKLPAAEPIIPLVHAPDDPGPEGEALPETETEPEAVKNETWRPFGSLFR
jgi:hypothetical protein